MNEPKWLHKDMVLALHALSVANFGGTAGIRDDGLLESALDRPKNLFAYGDNPSIFKLAAAYCTGIVKNRPIGRQQARGRSCHSRVPAPQRLSL